MDKLNYYLVLERRIGDYNIIDVNKLDICDTKVTNDIASIDTFTARFTEEELKNSIMRSNMASNYIDGTLKIISDAKHPHNLRVLTKDMFIVITEFQNSDEKISPDLKSKIFGLYKKIVESLFTDRDFIKCLLERFKETLKSQNKYAIFGIVEQLPYEKSRNIYLGIYDEEAKRKQELMRNLKLNDAA